MQAEFMTAPDSVSPAAQKDYKLGPLNHPNDRDDGSFTPPECDKARRCKGPADRPESSGVGDEARESFKKYWQAANKTFGLTSDGMMLKEGAQDDFSESDRTEIISWVTPAVQGSLSGEMKRAQLIVEIGAGIGRITPLLQQMCEKIIAVDFMQTYIDKNKASNFDQENRPNDEFRCEDATKLSLPKDSVDLLFWNWLLMYLSDNEVKSFVADAVSWIKIGGLIFGRESCGEPSTKKVERPWAEGGNPTAYRSHVFYTDLFRNYVSEKTGVILEPIFEERWVRVYEERAGTTGQRAWLFRRIA